MMRRLQIYLPEELYNNLRQEAFTQKTSIAEIVRQKMSKKARGEKGAKVNSAKGHFDDLLKFAKRMERRKWKGVPKNLASNVDYYLYGERRID